MKRKFTQYKCKNYRAGYIHCELCSINKTYIDLQNAECNSCFAPLLETNIKK